MVATKKRKDVKNIAEITELKEQLSECKIRIDHLKKEKSRTTQALSNLSQTVASDIHLEELLRLLMSITAELMNSKICSLMFYDKSKDELFLKATQSMSKEYLNKPNLKTGKCVIGKVVLGKKYLVVENVQTNSEYSCRDIAIKEGLFSLLAVPLIVDGEVIGVLNSYKDHIHQFTKDETDLLSAVANQAAIAIQKTKLIEEKKSLEDKLETRKLVDRAKGILMRKIAIDEGGAYRLIQKQSMDRRKSMKEIAEAIIIANDMKE